MFVEAELLVPLPLGVAKEALDGAVADGGLVAESRRAVQEGLVFLMPVGPRGSQGRLKTCWSGCCPPTKAVTVTSCRCAGRSPGPPGSFSQPSTATWN